MKRSPAVIILSLLIFIATSAFAYESDRTRPYFFHGKLNISPVPLVGQQARLSLDLTAVSGDCESATIQIKAPAGIAISGQSVFPRQRLIMGTSRRYTADIAILEEGSYALQATVYFQLSDGGRRAEHFFTYLVAGNTHSQVRDNASFLTVSRRPQTLAPPADQPAVGGTVSIGGHITYYDDNLSAEVPIRRVAVELLDGIQKIESVYTGDDGFYSFENVSSTGRNIQLAISFENDVLRVMNGESVPHRFELLNIHNAADGQINGDYCLDVRNQHRGIGHIFNCIMDVHDYLQSAVNWHRGVIEVKWPHGQHPQYASRHYMISGTVYEEHIQVPAGWEWHRRMLLHEYGHAVMTAMYKYNAHILPHSSFQGTHSIITISDPGFAIEEGWAEFFEALVDDNAYNLTAYANSNTPNIESNDWWTGDANGRGRNTRGELVEGAVASILWDIADTARSQDGSPGADDDGMDGRFMELWDLMLKYSPADILWLWDRWVDNGYSRAGALYSIYTENGIDVTMPDTVPIILADTAQSKEPVGVKGDVNSDGEIQSDDAAMILNITIGMIEPDDHQKWAADMNDDGQVGSDDAIAILRQVVGLTSSAYRQGDEGIPASSSLLQNFPNPFNPETWIPYQLKRDSDVTIRIYSTRGEIVREFDIGHRLAGIYASRERAAYWDGRNDSGVPVASGIYFYSIQAGDFAAVRKLTVVR